jgi:hypothetical protein
LSNFIFEELNEKEVKDCTDATIAYMKAHRLAPASQPRKVIERMLYGANSITLIAKESDKIVGVACGVRTTPPSILFLMSFERKYTLEGLEPQLVDNLLEVIKKRVPSAPNVITTLPTDNTLGVALYSARGFSVTGFVREGSHEMKKDVVILKKDLRKNVL